MFFYPFSFFFRSRFGGKEGGNGMGGTDGEQGATMLEAKRAAGMQTVREERWEDEQRLVDEEKGKVGHNRAWYPG